MSERLAARAQRPARSSRSGHDMDTDTETTALCPSGSHQASPPGTPPAGKGEPKSEDGSRSAGGELRTGVGTHAEQLCKQAGSVWSPRSHRDSGPDGMWGTGPVLWGGVLPPPFCPGAECLAPRSAGLGQGVSRGSPQPRKPPRDLLSGFSGSRGLAAGQVLILVYFQPFPSPLCCVCGSSSGYPDRVGCLVTAFPLLGGWGGVGDGGGACPPLPGAHYSPRVSQDIEGGKGFPSGLRPRFLNWEAAAFHTHPRTPARAQRWGEQRLLGEQAPHKVLLTP